jgi:sulfatase maturation enzyme AslB (radical SAM superfamily)
LLAAFDPTRQDSAVHLPIAPVEPAVPAERAPRVSLSALDTVWIQLTGTLCNIACRHCFITCGPQETRVPMMSTAAVQAALGDARRLGARDYYFTGGEPMLHPDFWMLCAETLRAGPLTVLTNGLLIDEAAARRARSLFDEAAYSFDLRVSLDGMSAEENDPVRGRGTFAEITAGIARLASVGLSPTLTIVEHASEMGSAARRAEFLAFCRRLGLRQPRLKYLPLLRMGREPRRTRAYQAGELGCLTDGPSLEHTVEERLVCSSSRLVAADGVYTCPILLDAPTARLGARLDESLSPIQLRWAGCRTCVADGLSCRT